jgi:phospholipid/cholesterol/gamma-HCH transport system substrate-binding protein
VRRALAVALVLAAGGLAAAFALGASAQAGSTARFDVIFDDARGLIGGQLVKIAGARAGTIENVVVTPGFKARIEATVDSRFMPFHKDATCTIRPEGLIAENYIDCDPGSANSPTLKGTGGNPPTVPVTNTTEPVSLLDLFNMFNLPTTERFQTIVNELGVGTAGQGDNFNDILRRANPTLTLANQAISILSRQKAQLAQIIDATNTIASNAAGHTGDLQQFLDRSASLTQLTAAHRGQLSQAIARLPGLLAQAQPALQQLDTVAVQGTPLVNQIHASVPALNQATSDLTPFVAAAKPALVALGGALKQAIPAITDTTPLVRTLSAYTKRSLPGTKLFARLSANLQQHGFVENFLSVMYGIATSLSRHDDTSHMLSILLEGPGNGKCGNYATTPVPGCSAHFGQQKAFTPTSRSTPRKAPRTHAAARRTAGAQPSTPPTTTPSGSQPQAGPSSPKHSSPVQAPPLPSVPMPSPSSTVQQTSQTLHSLVQYLLK